MIGQEIVDRMTLQESVMSVLVIQQRTFIKTR